MKGRKIGGSERREGRRGDRSTKRKGEGDGIGEKSRRG